MGCTAYYSLSIDKPDNDYIVWRFIASCKGAQDVLNEDGESNGIGDAYWDYKDALKEYSKIHPDYVFMVKIYNVDDHEAAYFKNGKMQTVSGKVVYEPFDEDKLQ